MRYLLTVLALLMLAACAGKQSFRDSCAANVDAAWQELDIAKAEGFSGSVSYSKALGLISLAKSMQTVENFDNCVKHAQDARFYIAESRKGQ
ncbi:hypothetical protein QWY82_09980 [Simiduia curdlanivorans]|uniref:Lipoprotein n=1 Tax=Simiduia curdlanivorans TaxID=1492769 RepID=A0ABV8UYZ5_9GAMM|nr:hypothetical protein [Simiduia curdlanivorans]MDN3639137.1 hypothetical protein [Simiduia curdlanivorans]